MLRPADVFLDRPEVMTDDGAPHRPYRRPNLAKSFHLFLSNPSSPFNSSFDKRGLSALRYHFSRASVAASRRSFFVPTFRLVRRFLMDRLWRFCSARRRMAFLFFIL